MSLETQIEGAVATVTLNHAESCNALSDAFLGEIVAELQRLDAAAEIRCAVIAGQDRFFCAGADLGELSDRDPIDVFLGRRAELWRAVRQVRMPLVAAVSGYCLGGGCELALACDIVVGSRTARFGQPETRLGLIPGGGGSQLLVRLVGPVIAADMVLSGRELTAKEAHRFGLIARLCDTSADCLAEAGALAAQIAERPRVGQLLAKQALTAAMELPLSGGIAFERAAYQVALSTNDAREGIAAFAEKTRSATRAARAALADGAAPQ
jgi:enoyl-CoA hydratase/carnithine racemase